jgi:hypothetical protein
VKFILTIEQLAVFHFRLKFDTLERSRKTAIGSNKIALLNISQCSMDLQNNNHNSSITGEKMLSQVEGVGLEPGVAPGG